MRQSWVMISRENEKIAKTKIWAKSLPKVYFFLHMETKLTLSTTIFPEIARNQCLWNTEYLKRREKVVFSNRSKTAVVAMLVIATSNLCYYEPW